MRRSAPTLLFAVLLLGAIRSADAQQPEASVTIRMGILQTDCYPSCDHSTEWLQYLHAEVRDSSGAMLPGSGLTFDWGVDYCAGYGLQYGFATGRGLDQIEVDGNLIKNVPDCCLNCEFQAYDVGLRVLVGDTWYPATRVRVPGIVIPSAPALHPNYPNPFSVETRVPFDLNEGAFVRMEILDVNGRTVALLAERLFAAGQHSLVWKPAGVASGTYLCRLTISAPHRPSVMHVRRLALTR